MCGWHILVHVASCNLEADVCHAAWTAHQLNHHLNLEQHSRWCKARGRRAVAAEAKDAPNRGWQALKVVPAWLRSVRRACCAVCKGAPRAGACSMFLLGTFPLGLCLLLLAALVH